MKEPLSFNLRRTVEDQTFAQMLRVQEMRKVEWQKRNRGEEMIRVHLNGLGGQSDTLVFGHEVRVRHEDGLCMIESGGRCVQVDGEFASRERYRVVEMDMEEWEVLESLPAVSVETG